jgi:S-(hydroxymethyl)glutathione dehydrogenase / alcohol dehydrogenase
MKAAILTKINEPLEIKDIALPGSLRYGQVLVEIICTGVCGAQLQEINGQKGNSAHLPHLLGHEGCGIVIETGPEVKIVKSGDKVVLHWRKGIGIDAAPATYDQGRIKAGPITTFSKFAIVSENRLTPIPQNVPAELGALFGCALSTALATVENVAKVRFGESVMVIGCGGVGLSLILAAKLARAFPVIGVDISIAKMKWAGSLGADFFANFEGTAKYDVIIDTTGTCPHTHSLAPSGRYILVGQPKHSMWAFETRHLFDGEGQTIQATQGGGFNPTLDIPRYVNLWRSGALNDYPKLISHRIKLDEINKGVKLMQDGKAARVMIFP